mmetsp:Transcript_23991/g.78202  ORF Transcript_23991/g.78202 Transcript_23991/m.78202 type:complete len:420 (+) Transcript_23991:752-2011(+)
MSLRSPNTSASPWECGAQRSPGCTSYSSQSRADEPGAPPARSIGQLSTPSPSRYGASPGGMEAVHGLPDAIATRVGSQSVAWNFSYETAPRGMPGPRTAPTTRVPPSQSVFLPPRRGKFELHVPSLPLVGPPLSLEKRTSESEVDWSASMDMQLKEASAAAASMRCSSARGTATSVSTKESMVAMSGSIMPAPLAVPTMEPPAAEARRSLGYRSVVMMARAAGSMLSRCSSAAAAGTASAISPTGSRQPITPVEAGSTDEAPPGSESASAAAAQTASESPTPSLPEHTFEILLLTTMACRSPPAASRFRPTVTGAPQKAFLVKTAAQLLEGASATMSVRFIVARVPSAASAGEKRKPAVPTWKPDGSVASAASACSYSLVDEKERICAVVARPVAMRRVPTRLVRAEASQSTIFVGVGE